MVKEYRNLQILCAVGFMLSCYATYVEIKAELDTNYKALCDISEKVSCTKAFSSRFDKGFDITGQVLGDDSKLNPPIGVIGIVFYSLLFFMASNEKVNVCRIEYLLWSIALLLSVYLSYLLPFVPFVLDDLCNIFFSIYVVNLFSFLECYRNFETIHRNLVDEIRRARNINLNKTD